MTWGNWENSHIILLCFVYAAPAAEEPAKSTPEPSPEPTPDRVPARSERAPAVKTPSAAPASDDRDETELRLPLFGGLRALKARNRPGQRLM